MTLKHFSFLLLIVLSSFASIAGEIVPLKDNILLAFEKCKALSADLEKGQLVEAKASSFDLICKKMPSNVLEFSCDFFDTGSTKKITQDRFSGGSNLGVAELKSSTGTKIRFLIGKNFATFEAPQDFKICLGFYLFEEEALKKKAVR
jgi:hypothetical protein